MATLVAPTVPEAADLVAVTSFGIVFPPFGHNVVPAPDVSTGGGGGGSDDAVGYAS